MGQEPKYKKDICCNPQCINGGKAADYDNPRCWLDPKSSSKIFCSPECGEHYLENIDEIERDNRFFSKLKTRKSRKIDELVEAIHICSGKTFDPKTIKEVIKKLNLSSPWI